MAKIKHGVRLERGDGGLSYTLVEIENGKPTGSERFCQTDWEFPSLAGVFGFVPCECGATDGTVDCKHKTASDMISAAIDFLDEHEGEEIETDLFDYFETW
jgi:hypothetical protein